MQQNNSKKMWSAYCENELRTLRPILSLYGYTLDAIQPHILGERYLMQAVTTSSGKKLILLGKSKTGNRVVIKATADTAGKKELLHERACKRVLKQINFASEIFYTPEEVDFIQTNTYIISIHTFIEQTSSFLERPIQEQFSLALSSFKGQEGAHATTSKHRKLIGAVFGIRDGESYLKTFHSFRQNIKIILPEQRSLDALLKKSEYFLQENKTILEQYSGFLTHTDFVPHNIRVSNGKIYLLDHSSLTFGNKYEGWARFCNFMQLYNQELLQALTQYVKDNRSKEEFVALKLMRVYRLGEIIWYYTDKLKYSEGNLLKLNTLRINLWTTILEHILDDKRIENERIVAYQEKRDALRSDDEKQRQKDLH